MSAPRSYVTDAFLTCWSTPNIINVRNIKECHSDDMYSWKWSNSLFFLVHANIALVENKQLVRMHVCWTAKTTTTGRLLEACIAYSWLRGFETDTFLWYWFTLTMVTLVYSNHASSNSGQINILLSVHCLLHIQSMCTFYSSFYSCVPSYLAFEWKWDWCWPCFHRNLTVFSYLNQY